MEKTKAYISLTDLGKFIGEGGQLEVVSYSPPVFSNDVIVQRAFEFMETNPTGILDSYNLLKLSFSSFFFKLFLAYISYKETTASISQRLFALENGRVSKFQTYQRLWRKQAED